MYKILEKKTLNEAVDFMVVHAPLVARNTLPGHFIILRVSTSSKILVLFWSFNF